MADLGGAAEWVGKQGKWGSAMADLGGAANGQENKVLNKNTRFSAPIKF